MSGSQLGECKPTQDQSAVATSIQLKLLWNFFIESTLLISLKNAFNRVFMVSSLQENRENILCNQALAVTLF